MAEGPRVGGSEAVCGGRRTVRAGQKRRRARKRKSHAAEEAGALVAQVASHATQRSATGSAVVTHRGGAERSRQRFSFPPTPTPARGRSRDPQQLSVSRGPGKADSG